MGNRGAALPPCMSGATQYHDFGGAYDICQKCHKTWYELWLEQTDGIKSRNVVFKLQPRNPLKESRNVSKTD